MLLEIYCDNSDVLDKIKTYLINISILIFLRLNFQFENIEKFKNQLTRFNLNDKRCAGLFDNISEYKMYLQYD